MKLDSFSRVALLMAVSAVLFVFSLHGHLNNIVADSASVRSVSVQATDGPVSDDGNIISIHYLRSISDKEDKLMQKLEQMGTQLAEVKKINAKLQREQTHTDNLPAVPETAAPTPHSTHIDPNDPCHKLRMSTTSLAISTPYAGACKKQSNSDVKPLSIATLIPGLAREKDVSFFPTVLKSLEAQTVPSDEVVIAISGVYDRLSIRYKHRMPDQSDFSKSDARRADKFCNDTLQEFSRHYTKGVIKIVCIGERLSAGRARNAAVSASSSDILAFIDSDDTAYPIRNEVIKNVFNDTMECRRQEGGPSLQMLLHSYRQNQKKQHPYEEARGYHLPPTSKILPGDQWTGEQCLEKEHGLELKNGRQLLASMAGRPTSWAIAGRAAHGHPVIRRNAFEKVHSSSIPKGEDIILLRDLMYTMYPQEAEQAVLFMNRPLTTYYRAGNANADLMDAKKERKGKEIVS